jgi:acetyltransferase-like isoleucine patch superfamily enzyme
VVRRGFWLGRGIFKTALLTGSPARVFLAPRTLLRNTSGIRFGSNVTLEAGVLIDGLAEFGIVLGDNVSIGAYSIIRGSSPTHVGEGLLLGNHSSCDAYCFFGAGGMITIGEHVIMGQHVCFHAETHNHDSIEVSIRTQGVTPMPIVVEDDCWIGANVTILGGSKLGRGSIVGAGAVVRGEFPPYSVIAGVPARLIRSRRGVPVPG